MAKVVLFGIEESADLADIFITEDSEHEIVAFTVHERYLPEGEQIHRGKPIYPFETLKEHCPPTDFKLFAHVFPKRMNEIREKIYLEGKAMGYEYINYISSTARIWTEDIGENVMIVDHCIVQPFTSIGNNTCILMANHIGHHCEIGDHCYITGHVCIAGHSKVGNYCFIGPNVCANHKVNLAEGTFLGTGAVLLNDTEPWFLYVGNPAVKKGKSKVACRHL